MRRIRKQRRLFTYDKKGNVVYKDSNISEYNGKEKQKLQKKTPKIETQLKLTSSLPIVQLVPPTKHTIPQITNKCDINHCMVARDDLLTLRKMPLVDEHTKMLAIILLNELIISGKSYTLEQMQPYFIHSFEMIIEKEVKIIESHIINSIELK